MEQVDSESSSVFMLRDGKEKLDANGKLLRSRVPDEVCEKGVVLKAGIHIADISNAAKPSANAIY